MAQDLTPTELLAELVKGKPTGVVVFFDNGTGTDVRVLVSDAAGIFESNPKWKLKNVIE